MYQLGFDFQAVSTDSRLEQVGFGDALGRPNELLLLLRRSPQKYFVPSGRSQIVHHDFDVGEDVVVGNLDCCV